MDARKELTDRLTALLGGQDNADELVAEILRDYIITKDSGGPGDIRDNIIHFLGAKRVEGLSDRTLKTYKLYLNSFAGRVAKDVADITTDDIRAYIVYLTEERRLKDSSLQTQIGAMRSLFAWLLIEDAISKNPMLKIRMQKQNEINGRDALTQDELEMLRNACKTYKEKALVEFLVSTGCRVSEVIGLSLRDLDMYKRSVKVIGKGNKERTVYFSPRAKLMIEEYHRERAGGSALFAGTRAPYNVMQTRAIQKLLRKIGERAGLSKRVHPHLLRHTFASLALNAGMDITVIQALLGHSKISTTQIYAKLNQDTVRHEYYRLVA